MYWSTDYVHYITRARHACLRPNIIAMRAIDPHRSGGNGDLPPRLLTVHEARCLDRPRAPTETRGPGGGALLRNHLMRPLGAPRIECLRGVHGSRHTREANAKALQCQMQHNT